MSIKIKLFTNKEHYLTFRAAWASAVNDVRAKSTLVRSNEWLSSGCGGTMSEGTGCMRKAGWIRAEHTILYNILREKPITAGFTPTFNKMGLLNGHRVNCKFESGTWMLHRVIHLAKRSLQPLNGSKWEDGETERCQRAVNRFLAPFNRTITAEMLIQVKCPVVKAIDIWYNPKIVSRIIDDGWRPTMEELLPLMTGEQS